MTQPQPLPASDPQPAADPLRIGDRHGSWTIEGPVARVHGYNRGVWCRCDCGARSLVRLTKGALASKSCKSCALRARAVPRIPPGSIRGGVRVIERAERTGNGWSYRVECLHCGCIFVRRSDSMGGGGCGCRRNNGRRINAKISDAPPEKDAKYQWVRRVYPGGATQSEIAAVYGCTRQAVEHIENRAMRKLRKRGLALKELLCE